ncbi:unnamed protein product [Meganyctiphanes norvegica]|uniref:Ig-like domain-containing protein n=1 Tax=Meganyctiphanes norvegica TaxID=48144 RepID=A0AAV2QZC6_MEGNR
MRQSTLNVNADNLSHRSEFIPSGRRLLYRNMSSMEQVFPPKHEAPRKPGFPGSSICSPSGHRAKTWHCILSLLLLLIFMPGGLSVKILEVKVPRKAQMHSDVRLECRFDLEGAELYSLTWWRGPDQFYQYSPSQKEKLVVHNTSGIFVDETRSGGSEVQLLSLSRASSGKYKCEVLADYPSFEKDSKYATMEVVDVPSGPPMIQVGRQPPSTYVPGELLTANCTSPGAVPPPLLLWYINGEKVYPQPLTRPLRQMYDDYNLGHDRQLTNRVPDQVSELSLRLKDSHFNNGLAKLTCAATLQDVYHNPTDVKVTRPGYKTAAPSLKLFGAASQPYSSPAVTLSISLLICVAALYC